MMPPVLAVLNRPATAPAVLAAARLVGMRLGAGVEVLHVRAMDTHIVGVEIVPEAERARRDAEIAQRSRELRALFDAAGLAGVAWRELSGVPREIVAAHARNAAVVVLGQAPAMFYEDAWIDIDAALLDAGAAVLLVPEAVPTVLGAHVAVAWKPDAVAGHALAAAMPLLLQAAQVSVLIASEHGQAPSAPAALLAELEEAHVAHAVYRFEATGHVGTALGVEALALGADLLVMGAFGHSRLREFLFGGATHEILASLTLPVLLRH